MCCFAVSRGHGGFRKLWEARRIYVRLSWYLSNFMVLRYGQKKTGDVLFRVPYVPVLTALNVA